MSAVIGGGISGLATAHYLLKNLNHPASKVTLYEASQRTGGWIQSLCLPSGLVFEQGPRTVRPKGPQGANTLALIEELGLSDKVLPIPSNHPAALNRFIYVNKELHKLPSNLLSLFLRRPPFSKPLVSSIFKDIGAPKKTCDDESIYHFVERRLGKEVADYAIAPMICGICAGDAREISVKFLMKSLFEAEQNSGSISRGLLENFLKGKRSKRPDLGKLSRRASSEKWSVWSLKGGLEEFPKALETSVVKAGADVLTNSSCQELTFSDDKRVAIKVRGVERWFDHVFSTIPAPQLAALVRRQHPELSEDLAKIPTVSVAVVNLHYEGKLLKHEAFGFLIPPSENVPILGVIYDSCCFPRGDSTVLTVMMGGKWFVKWFGQNPPPGLLLSTATEHVRQILDIKEHPLQTRVSVLKSCIPQYVVGHHERVARMRNYVKFHRLPLSLIGASYDGVGVNDVVMSAKVAAEGYGLKRPTI